jgi:hypothetical protein
MAIEKLDRVPPHVAIQQEIAKHRRSMMVAASGMGPLLDILDAYITRTEARLALIETIANLGVGTNGKAT